MIRANLKTVLVSAVGDHAPTENPDAQQFHVRPADPLDRRFIPLAQYKPSSGTGWLTDLAAGLFLIATLTDVVDGYLARRYKMHTSLGRLLDPFVDKVLICGTFIFLIGPNFHQGGKSLTDLAGWMVALIVARELLVTSLRGYSEAQGMAFSATVYGKIKMFLQSTTVVVILISLGHFHGQAWARGVRLACVWVMVIFTLFSMLGYISRYSKLTKSPSAPD